MMDADTRHLLFGDIRGIVSLGIVAAVDDTGQAQRVTVKRADGATHADVEVLQPFGFASMPPAAGAVCLLLAVGADPANLVALPIGCPAQRYGAQAAGESTLYAADGTRVAVRAGGVVEVWGGTQVIVNSPQVTVTAAGGVTINANLLIDGDLKVTGDITDKNGEHGTLAQLRDAYDIHKHRDVQFGSASTGTTDTPV